MPRAIAAPYRAAHGWSTFALSRRSWLLRAWICVVSNDILYRWALGVEYDGSLFSGWQRQLRRVTVQESLETALTRIAAEPVRVVASGRTDAGVHATGQVTSFVTRAQRPVEAWVRGTNSLTPAGLSVIWACRVEEGFNARFSATARRYQYVWLPAAHAPAIGARFVTWVRDPLVVPAMHEAAQAVLGEHDFSSFRAASCQSHTPFRCVHSVAVRRRGDFVVLDIVANAFLHHMVRNIAGSLQRIGAGQATPAWLPALLAAKDRTLGARTAPPNGLYLTDVRYGDQALPAGRPPLLLRGADDIC